MNQPLISDYPIGPFQIKKYSIRKVLNNLFGHLWVAELKYKYIFFFKFTLRYQKSDIVDTSGKFVAIINDTSSTGGKFNTGVLDTDGKFAASVVDISVKFATGDVDTMMQLDM